MTDIVKRLRAYAKVWGNEPSIPPHPGTSPGFTTGMVIGDANDAADEIEKLRATNELLWEVIKLQKEKVTMLEEAISDTRKILRGET